MSRPVTVQFLKNPDITHWGFEARWLGQDEWGDWIAIPEGSKRWKGAEIVRPTRSDAVFCAPRGEWWHLHYTGSLWGDIAAFIDIVTPPVWVSQSRYEMIDLDLDVALHTDGTVELQDEDEFEAHQVHYGYTQEMINRAAAETRRVIDELQRRHEPFFEVAERWLARVGR
jgi:protein associated with RNAse G/E